MSAHAHEMAIYGVSIEYAARKIAAFLRTSASAEGRVIKYQVKQLEIRGWRHAGLGVRFLSRSVINGERYDLPGQSEPFPDSEDVEFFIHAAFKAFERAKKKAAA